MIKNVIRESDLAGRMGGDEFIAFLQNVDDENILREKTSYLNEKLLTYAKKIMGNDMQIPLGTSIGAVFVPEEGRDFQTLYKKADSALYNVKQHGKHSLSVFGTHNHSKISVEGLSQLRMILGERNVEPGAYFVDFETFKSIYRLFMRMDNKNLVLMQFTLPEKDLAKEFKEILIHTLRKSDCVTQNGKKFLILLIEAREKDSDIVKDRIMSRAKNIFAGKIGFEREEIF